MSLKIEILTLEDIALPYLREVRSYPSTVRVQHHMLTTKARERFLTGSIVIFVHDDATQLVKNRYDPRDADMEGKTIMIKDSLIDGWCDTHQAMLSVFEETRKEKENGTVTNKG